MIDLGLAPSPGGSTHVPTSELRPDRREHLLVVPAPVLEQPTQLVLGCDVALEGAEEIGVVMAAMS